ncbi:MAG: hypothetical protein ACREUC_03350, partial [Steroidobacteraceae bacterium]
MEDAAERTTAAGDSVEEMAKQFAEANAKSEEFSNTIEKLNNEQLLQLEEKLRADIEAADALGESTDRLKEKLTQVYERRSTGLEDTLAKTAGQAGKVATAVDGASNKLRGMQQAGQGARNIIEGVSQGGFVGLTRAAQGAVTVIRSFASGAIGVTLLPALALAAGALLLMKRRTEENEAAIKKMGDEANAKVERLKVAYAELEKAAEKSAAAQIAAIEKVSASYDEYLARIQKNDALLNQSIKLQTDTKSAEIDRDEQA